MHKHNQKAQTEKTESHFPSRQELELYEKAIPGSGIRLLKFAENLQKSRFQIHHETLKMQNRLSILGMLLIFMTFVSALAIASYLGLNGIWVVASVIGFLPVTLIGFLVYAIRTGFIRTTYSPSAQSYPALGLCFKVWSRS